MCAINLWMNQSTLLNQALLQSIHIAVNIISSGEDKPRTGGRCLHNYLPEKKKERKQSRRGINISLSTVKG
jgi:hypothetical protein